MEGKIKVKIKDFAPSKKGNRIKDNMWLVL